ncbi:hypothetical protein [Mycolicibacterium sp. A43C]
MTPVTVQTFAAERDLHDRIAVMNYDEGIVAELACVDTSGAVFLTCATDQGDLIGVSYYRTSAEGYMYHYGSEATEANTTDYLALIDWKPKFPVYAIGAAAVSAAEEPEKPPLQREHAGYCWPTCGCPDSEEWDWDGFSSDINGGDADPDAEAGR